MIPEQDADGKEVPASWLKNGLEYVGVIKGESSRVDQEKVKKVADEYFNIIKEARYSSNSQMITQTKSEIEAACGELIRTVTLKPASTYDTVFWMFFYEDNPFVMSRIKGATVLSFVVHILFIAFYLKSMKFGQLPYFGDHTINTVRLICAMLLHMQMYPDIENARKMMTFLIHNPERFATDMLIWPGMVVFLKVVTTVGAQIAAVQAML